MEITQFTYFQQVGGFEVELVPVELTYGLERIAMYVQGCENVFDLIWTKGISYGEVFKRAEWEHSSYSFDRSDRELLFQLFELYEREAGRMLALDLVLPGYDYILKCSHCFNLLRPGSDQCYRTDRLYRAVRKLARDCAQRYLQQREAAGYPLLNGVSLVTSDFY